LAVPLRPGRFVRRGTQRRRKKEMLEVRRLDWRRSHPTTASLFSFWKKRGAAVGVVTNQHITPPWRRIARGFPEDAQETHVLYSVAGTHNPKVITRIRGETSSERRPPDRTRPPQGRVRCRTLLNRHIDSLHPETLRWQMRNAAAWGSFIAIYAMRQPTRSRAPIMGGPVTLEDQGKFFVGGYEDYGVRVTRNAPPGQPTPGRRRSR